MKTDRLNAFTDGVIAIIITIAAYVVAIGVALAWPLLAVAIYFAVAAMWLVPDTRFEHLGVR